MKPRSDARHRPWRMPVTGTGWTIRPGRLFRPATVVVMIAGMVGPLAATAARAETPICNQTLPAAAEGRIVLDRSSVRSGESTLAMLSGFTHWPSGLIGGGSGETFLSCTPWTPLGRAEVMPSRLASVLLLSVPAGTPQGRYQVGVVFYQGDAASSPVVVRLRTALTVTNSPDEPASPSPACRTAFPNAPTGSLSTASSARQGSLLGASIDGVTSAAIQTLNEYDRLSYVACFAGVATPVTKLAAASAKFVVRVGSDLAAGIHSLVVYGILNGSVVSWHRDVLVTAVSPPSASDSSGRPSTTSSGRPSTTSSEPPSASHSATTSERAPSASSSATVTSSSKSSSGPLTLGLVAAAVALVAGASGVLWSRRGRPRR